jgi:hypothetical protein
MATAAKVAAQIERLLGLFTFELPGRSGKGMANEILDTFVESIADRSLADQAAPSGVPWPDNADSTKADPEKQGRPVGVLYGDMLSVLNLRGTREIQPTRAVMRYGVHQFARRKAQWFSCGSEAVAGMEPSGATNQPERRFYEVNATDKALARERIGEIWNEFLQDVGL